MYDYLFICAANVGRSQMAEGFYNHYTKGKNAISAAGIEDVGKKYDYKPHKDIISVMLEKGIDISNQRIDVLEEGMILRAKRILLFCDPKKCPSYLTDVLYVPVEDPYYSGVRSSEKQLEKFRTVRDNIEGIILDTLRKDK